MPYIVSRERNTSKYISSFAHLHFKANFCKQDIWKIMNNNRIEKLNEFFFNKLKIKPRHWNLLTSDSICNITLHIYLLKCFWLVKYEQYYILEIIIESKLKLFLLKYFTKIKNQNFITAYETHFNTHLYWYRG